MESSAPGATTSASLPTSTVEKKRPFDAIAESEFVAERATAEPFPVFEEDDFPRENTPSTLTPPPPTSSSVRRRSRSVTEQDLRLFRGLPNRKVFDYVDLVKCLRTPAAPGKLPAIPVSQLGTERIYTPNPHIRATSPPPWAQ